MSGASPRSRPRRPVHGVLLLDKPLGLTSNQALQRAKRLLAARKAGHTGTLDPLATGVLPICFGAATKFSGLHLAADKRYEARLRLGVRTSTGDAEGEVIDEQAVPPLTDEQLRTAEKSFTGTLSQLPPMHSALKHKGRALYEYAREGREVERKPREVQVFHLSLALLAPDLLQLQVHCGSGTYVRTLGEDIATALGSCGHLVALRRTTAGQFGAEQCIDLPGLEALEEGARQRQLLPVEAMLPTHVPVTLPAAEAGRFLCGLRRRGNWPDHDQVAVYGSDPHAFLGTAHARAGELIPDRLLSPDEIAQILAIPAPGGGARPNPVSTDTP